MPGVPWLRALPDGLRRLRGRSLEEQLAAIATGSARPATITMRRLKDHAWVELRAEDDDWVGPARQWAAATAQAVAAKLEVDGFHLVGGRVNAVVDGENESLDLVLEWNGERVLTEVSWLQEKERRRGRGRRSGRAPLSTKAARSVAPFLPPSSPASPAPCLSLGLCPLPAR
jgi:hypothetical protein